MHDSTSDSSRAASNRQQRDVMARLEEDHVRIARVLETLERVLKVGADDQINWEIVADIISYLQEYPDAVHHPVEDQLFDRVLDKGLTPAERELVHTNLAQHAQIIGATVQLAADVNDIMNDIVVPVERLQEHFEHYLELQRTHMRNEVQHLFPLAERQLGDDDWGDIAQEIASHADPMFELNVGKFAALYEYLTK